MGSQLFSLNPFISVIIPTYNDYSVLLRCISALESQTYPSDRIEVIIINNSPQDRLIFPHISSLNIVVIDEPKPGSYSARNKGLSLVSGDIVAFTDSDCIPFKDWIENGVSAFLENKDIERLSGEIRIFRAINSSWLAWKFESITAFNQKYNATKGVGVTANLFVKRSVFDKVGKFNDSLMSGGDIEWNQRATELGVPITFCKNVSVEHPARKTIKDLFRKFRRVVGGGFSRAKNSKKVFRFIIWHFIPPVRYGNVLIHDGKKLHEVIFACFIFWVLKISMVLEIFRLALGGKPLR